MNDDCGFLIFEVTGGRILLFPSRINNRHSTIVNSNRWSPFQALCKNPPCGSGDCCWGKRFRFNPGGHARQVKEIRTAGIAGFENRIPMKSERTKPQRAVSFSDHGLASPRLAFPAGSGRKLRDGPNQDPKTVPNPISSHRAAGRSPGLYVPSARLRAEMPAPNAH
jgi:hypothetical protein